MASNALVISMSVKVPALLRIRMMPERYVNIIRRCNRMWETSVKSDICFLILPMQKSSEILTWHIGSVQAAVILSRCNRVGALGGHVQ